MPNKVVARAKGLRVSPRKMGLVATLVRGRSLDDALTILAHTPKSAAPMLRELIKSAAANAEHNYQQNAKDLKVDAIQVGSGLRLKRFRPVARGAAHRYVHAHSNVMVTLSELRPTKGPKAKPTVAVAKQVKT